MIKHLFSPQADDPAVCCCGQARELHGARLPDYGTTRRLISDFFLDHRGKIMPPVLEVGSARPADAWWADIRSQLGMQDEEWIGVDKKPSPSTDVVSDLSHCPPELAGIYFGSCVCAETLEHVDWPADFLGKILTMLRPGAWIVITTPFAFPVHESTGPDYWRFTASGLKLLLNEAGFEQPHVYPLEMFAHEYYDHLIDPDDFHHKAITYWHGAIARKPE